jgi:putative membrane protein
MPASSAAAEGDDSHFAMKAASGGMSEVKLGQLGAEKGSNQAVKQFGQRMVTDHSKANEELKSVAAQTNVKLPNAMGKEEADTYARLCKLSGKEFDQAYAKAMVKDHEQDVADFQKESTMGKNESMKDFAAKTLPTLQSRNAEECCVLFLGHVVDRIFRDTSKHPFEGRAPTERFQRTGVFLEFAGVQHAGPHLRTISNLGPSPSHERAGATLRFVINRASYLT